jgi:hypothetical protein
VARDAVVWGRRGRAAECAGASLRRAVEPRPGLATAGPPATLHGHAARPLAPPLAPAEIPVDGPPFIDVHAKQGRGFEVDFERVQKYLGPGKISLSDYQKDMETVNKVYLPTVHKSYVYLRIGSGRCVRRNRRQRRQGRGRGRGGGRRRSAARLPDSARGGARRQFAHRSPKATVPFPLVPLTPLPPSPRPSAALPIRDAHTCTQQCTPNPPPPPPPPPRPPTGAA